MHDTTLFIGMISSNEPVSHFLQMYSLDVGIENLLDSISTRTVFVKIVLWFFEYDTLRSWYISFMATCMQTVICQCGSLGCIICGKITCYIVFIMSSTFLLIVFAMLVMIYMRPKHIRIWTILDILAIFAIF